MIFGGLQKSDTKWNINFEDARHQGEGRERRTIEVVPACPVQALQA